MFGHQSVLLFGAEPPGVGLFGQRPLDVALRLGDERGVFEQIGERHQAVEIVRPALPAFAGPSEPSAGGAHVGPELVEPPGEPARLNLQLSPEPALRAHRPSGSSENAPGLNGTRLRTTRDAAGAGSGCGARARRERWGARVIASAMTQMMITRMDFAESLSADCADYTDSPC